VFSIPHYDFSGVLADADVLLTVPPFAKLEWACLALHILQACAKREGFTVQVFYANLAMAAWVGEDNYRSICNKGYLGEAIFARYVHKSINQDIKLDDQYIEIRDSLGNWIASLMNGVLKNSYKILGCSTTYEQINPSIAFVNYAKQIQPELITVLGGSNCYRELAPAMFSLSDQIDYIFSGESEISFPNFLKNVLDGKYPKERIIQEEICDINEIPVPDYSDYLRQLEYFLPQSKLFQESQYYLSYETSRGCWWGQKHRCNFCGALNDMSYREKNPEKVIRDLKHLKNKYHIKYIMMTDLIMPYNYFKALLPQLVNENLNLKIFYEVKSNLSFEQLILLKKAGIFQVQAGIETLSSSLLKKMSKGVTARQNITFLRNARTIGIEISWSFLYKFPQDTEEEYRELLQLLPLIVHFNPPNPIQEVSIVKFCPLYNFPDKFGIVNIIPESFYQNLFPSEVISKIAYFHRGDFDCFARPEEPLIQNIIRILTAWRKKWENGNRPKLKLTVNSHGKFLLIDTRGLDEPLVQTISKKQAMTIILDRPIDIVPSELQAEIDWGLQHKLLVELDSWYISLVTANLELIAAFKRESQTITNASNINKEICLNE